MLKRFIDVKNSKNGFISRQFLMFYLNLDLYESVVAVVFSAALLFLKSFLNPYKAKKERPYPKVKRITAANIVEALNTKSDPVLRMVKKTTLNARQSVT